MNDETKVLLKEYEILVDLIKHYHTRRHDLNRIVLIINAILIGTCTAIMQVSFSTILTFRLIVLLSILGISISVIWLLASQRITIDTDLRYHLLRYIERCLGRDPGIFTFGRKFFREKHTKKKELKLPDGKDSLKFPKVYQRFPVVWTGWFLPSFFIGAYIPLLYVGIKYWN